MSQSSTKSEFDFEFTREEDLVRQSSGAAPDEPELVRSGLRAGQEHRAVDGRRRVIPVWLGGGGDPAPEEARVEAGRAAHGAP